MKPLQNDLSGFDRVGLDIPPVGIKFEFFQPVGIKPLALDKSLSLCEMIVEAQKAEQPFYFSTDHNEICVGKILLGMDEMELFAHSGQIGERLQVFQEARANYKLYQHVPKLEKGVVNYLVFSPLQCLNFEPDIFIVNASIKQAEVVLRAMSYSTGEILESKTTPVMGCAWLLLYPYQTGKVNYLVPEMVHGMSGRQLFPPNTMLVSIPYQWLPTVAANLKEMPIHLPTHFSKEQYLNEFSEILGDLAEKARKP